MKMSKVLEQCLIHSYDNRRLNISCNDNTYDYVLDKEVNLLYDLCQTRKLYNFEFMSTSDNNVRLIRIEEVEEELGNEDIPEPHVQEKIEIKDQLLKSVDLKIMDYDSKLKELINMKQNLECQKTIDIESIQEIYNKLNDSI